MERFCDLRDDASVSAAWSPPVPRKDVRLVEIPAVRKATSLPAVPYAVTPCTRAEAWLSIAGGDGLMAPYEHLVVFGHKGG